VLRRSTSKRSAGEVSVRDTRKFFSQPIATQLALSAGLLLVALGPVAQLVVSESWVMAPVEREELPKVTASQVLQAALKKLPQAIVTKATIKLDLAGISPAEFGDWEEPGR
jgi:hypothetical protein